ncbi:unnamed protein product [Heligmosomoides polygyrus]|uniref:V-type proton ATPase subunit G n=1 Tax=Heligmosomoides polygyrus TaxID=6339 RepID=A0A183F2W3_HELPZ|nr:unnamed protein product [Heligmosomoides polygyrus]
MSVWEVEAAGRTKILEAKDRRLRLIEEARYQAQVELEQFRKEKEDQFQAKLKIIDEKIQKHEVKSLAKIEDELSYMDARVKLCKPMVIELLLELVTTARYAMHRNVDTRRWVYGLDTSSKIPPDRRICDKSTWELIQRYASNCEKLATRIPIARTVSAKSVKSEKSFAMMIPRPKCEH